MQTNTSASRGFSIVEVIIALVALIIIGGVGYLAYTNFVAKPKASTASVASTTPTASIPPAQVNSNSDLNNISNQLDGLNLDDNESSQYDSAANSF